jgi:nucleoside-diphosphate-sugar epimerase
MRILITGGSGFLGSSLARELLKKPSLSLLGSIKGMISEIVMTDLLKLPNDLAQNSRVTSVIGDLGELIHTNSLQLQQIDAVIHLAGAVSAECENNLDLGLHINLQVSLSLLQALRAQAQKPVFIFASSVAVFGAPQGQQLPISISDTFQPAPQSSYGIQKFMVEQLVADFTRKGFVNGRNVRLMTVSVRPGRPNGAASSFMSGLFREPLAGQTCIVPVPAETRVALASTDKTLEGLICALETPSSLWGPPTAVNLPALSTTVGEMAKALEIVAGPAVARLLQWQVDPKISEIVSGWPGQFDNIRAHQLGLKADDSVISLIQAYARRHPQAIQFPLQF